MRKLVLLAAGLAMLAGLTVWAKEVTELRDRVRDGVQRTDKDLAKVIHRDKLNDQQRARLDSITQDFDELREAVASKKWEGERDRFERAVDNLDNLIKQAPISDEERQTLGIDLYTLQVILDAWKK